MIGMDVKKVFFDREAVTGAVDKAARKVLSRFGAFVRRGAKSSIRKRKRVSSPGEPPSSHTGLLKRLIYFGYDRQRRSVVIGPQRLNQKVGDAPAALEYGASVSAPLRRDKTRLPRRSRRRRRVKITARPYMRPAFQKEQPKLPAMWGGSVR